MDLGFVAVPTIVVLAYLIAEVFKAFSKSEETLKKFIPVVCGISGLILGVAIFYVAPTIIEVAKDVFTAAAIGTVSGLSATGVNQVFKIAKRSKTEVK